MSAISISKLYTANEKGKETNFFEWDDPFSLVIDIDVDKARAGAAYPLEVTMSIWNPRTDPTDVGPWIDQSGTIRYSLDFTWPDIHVDAKDTTLVWKKTYKFTRSWTSYGALMGQLKNGNRAGVFGVRATARLIYFPDFATKDSHWFHFAGYTPPADPKPKPPKKPESTKRGGAPKRSPLPTKKTPR